MKNDQKNMKNLFMPWSCMFEQCLSSALDKTIKWHLIKHIWSLNLNLVFKPTPFNLLLVALGQSTTYCHFTFMHHIVPWHWLCPSLFASNRPLSDANVSDDVIDDIDEELYYLQECQASKTPLFILIQSHSLAPALFYCIRTRTIQLL